jgi:hypothetical protein
MAAKTQHSTTATPGKRYTPRVPPPAPTAKVMIKKH